jgi:hypothetical protein
MANTNFAIDGKLGVKFDRVSTDPEFALGTVAIGNDHRVYTYVQASGAVATGTCSVDASYQCTDAAGTYTADTALADNEYGWVWLTTSPF